MDWRYDSRSVVIDDLSLVMNGETIPDGGCWMGIPCQPELQSDIVAAVNEDVIVGASA
jgi:hypothetical protein